MTINKFFLQNTIRPTWLKNIHIASCASRSDRQSPAQQLVCQRHRARGPLLLWIFAFYTNFTNEHTGQLLVGPNALWPNQPKFWVGHGPPGPRCSAPPHGNCGCRRRDLYRRRTGLVYTVECLCTHYTWRLVDPLFNLIGYCNKLCPYLLLDCKYSSR